MTGGSSFELHVEHTAAAISTGLCDTVLITYGSDQLSRLGRQLGTRGHFAERTRVEGPAQFEAPYGGTIVSSYALAAARHMHEYGTTSEQLASIAVAARAYAAQPRGHVPPAHHGRRRAGLADGVRPPPQARLPASSPTGAGRWC